MRSVLVFIGMTAIGLALTFTIGSVHVDPLLNILAVTFGAGAIGGGVHALRSRAVMLASNAGIDQFGIQQWGHTRPGTRKEATQLGWVLLGVGLLLFAFGLFAGAVA